MDTSESYSSDEEETPPRYYTRSMVQTHDGNPYMRKLVETPPVEEEEEEYECATISYSPLTSYTSISRENKVEYNEVQPKNTQYKYWGLLIMVISVLAIVYQDSISNTFSSTERICRKLNHVESSFTQQSQDLWPALRSVKSRDGSKVASMVFLHSPEASRTANCLADQVAKVLACSDEFDIMTPDTINGYKDYGEILPKYENGSTALVIRDLNKVKGNIAQVFHVMCDDVTEYKSPAFYIFTISVDSSTGEKPVRLARTILQNAWKELPFNVLDPLLARILGHVYLISNENELPCKI